MILYFATWLEDGQGERLTIADADHRLLSYFFLRDVENDKEFHVKYIGEGVIPVLKKKAKL